MNFFTFDFSFLVVALEAYRNRYDALNFMASGGKLRG